MSKVILTEEEREALTGISKCFSKSIRAFKKDNDFQGVKSLFILFKSGYIYKLALFDMNFDGMEFGKEYTLKDMEIKEKKR